MAKKLYVKNLSYQTTENDLIQYFSSAGQVRYAKILREHDTDRSRGCGFVEMSSMTEAEKALAELNSTEFMGRQIFIEEARERAPRPNLPVYRPQNTYRPDAQPEMTMHSTWAQPGFDQPSYGGDSDRRRKRFDRNSSRKNRHED